MSAETRGRLLRSLMPTITYLQAAARRLQVQPRLHYEGRISAMSSAAPPPTPPSSAGGGDPGPSPGRPRLGAEVGRGAEGVVYENADQPGWVVKVFHPATASPFQAQNEFENLERARAIRPDNVVKALSPFNRRQGWLVKEHVYPSNQPPDLAQRNLVVRDFQNIPDADGNLMWGATADNPVPRWLLIE